MVFESVSADSAVWACDLVARCCAVWLARGVVPWFTKTRAVQFDLIPRCISLLPGCINGLTFSFSPALVASFTDGPIRRFGIRLVQQIDCELLARSLCWQRRLLWARGRRSEVRASALALPGPSVPEPV